MESRAIRERQYYLLLASNIINKSMLNSHPSSVGTPIISNAAPLFIGKSSGCRCVNELNERNEKALAS